LISRDAMRSGAIGLAPGEAKQRDLSWQDWTVPFDISEDGKIMLFTEAGEAGGGEYAVFTRETKGSSAVRLGQGSARALSPDGKWALVLRQNMNPPDFMLLPTGIGQSRTISTGNIVPNRGKFLPDSKRIVFDGGEPGHASRIYMMSIDGEAPRAITPEGFTIRGQAISPDGKHVAVSSGDGISIASVDGSEPRPAPGSQPGDVALRWADGQSLFVGRRGDTACEVSRLNVQTGARTSWKTFSPADVAGLVGAACPLLAGDEEHYVFGYNRNLSDLFLVEHLR
jgi:dipeptidyl aminopeptidase/acylaminoacyl peptidase